MNSRIVRLSVNALSWAAIVCGGISTLAAENEKPAVAPFRLGIIGLDTSHAIAFAQEFNKDNPAEGLSGFKVVAAYPKGSSDILSSTQRVAGYIEEIKKVGVEIVDSIPQLLDRVDGVLLETNDGRPHLEQVRPVLAAKKPVFIDKPVAGTLVDAITIYREAEAAGVPIFSSSGLRFGKRDQEIRSGALGKVMGADTFSPCSLEATHPDLFWYGIHGVERLYTLMGPGCEEVTRTSSQDFEQVVGRWSDGRIGSFRGIRKGGSGYGGTVFGESAVEVLGTFEGYRPLIVSIAEFFRTGKPPVAAAETIELYAFMEAADESKRNHGAAVRISDVLKAAEAKVQRQ